MKKKFYNSLSEIFDMVKQRFIDEQLTFDDVQKNTSVDPELIRIFFDGNNNVVNDLSRIISFSRIRLREKHQKLKIYEVSEENNIIKANRFIHPRCSIYYSRVTNEFSKFQLRPIKTVIPKTEKNILISELQEQIFIYLEKNNIL